MTAKFFILAALFFLSVLGHSCSPAVRAKKAHPPGDGPGAPDKAQAPADADPYLWLEEIESAEALGWARHENEMTEKRLIGDARFADLKKNALDILQATDRIPFGRIRGGYVYNFWQDESHVRGLWRRSPLASYVAPEPAWEDLLDVDALAEKEGEPWVLAAITPAPAPSLRCMISLSRGGKDATVKRELDVATRTFVDGGFALPEAKSEVAWVDADTLIVGTDFGPGSLTDSGYPRVLKLWRRGTDLAAAPVVYEAAASDVSAFTLTSFAPGGKTVIVGRAETFFESAYALRDDDGTLHPVAFPKSSELQAVCADQVLAKLRQPWQVGQRTLPAGSLVGLSIADIRAHRDAAPRVVVLPEERTTIQEVVATADRLLVTLLRNVQGEVRAYRTGTNGEWTSETLALPQAGTLSAFGAEPMSAEAFIQFDGFLQPTTLYLSDGITPPRLVKSLPARFDAAGMTVEQLEAASADGTRVPYFLVHPVGWKSDGSNPVILEGYGGFEVPMTPYYGALRGKLWLERGGAYALANIRGGGEFGPQWHQAALKEHRQRAFDDFIAVAEDLIKRGHTSARRLGIEGGSNGGLLVGAVLTQRPDLLNAVVCSVPLLDMLRYHKLLAGASWMAEYGDPDDAAMRPFIAAYSPYQNVRKERHYPEVFFYTSTKDDRVHPGHARKMVARMREQGHPVLYFEHIEGGHAAATNQEQRARRFALETAYFMQKLMD